MKQVKRTRKVAIIHCDHPRETIFNRGKRRGIHLSELSRMAILESNFMRGTARLEPRIHYPLLHVDGFPKIDEIDGVIIPGSVYTTDRKSLEKMDWMKRLIDFIRKVHDAQRPLLGSCFGHQALGTAFGVHPVKFGEDVGAEVGFHRVTQVGATGKKDRLFSNIPWNFQGAFFHYYYLPELPKDAVLLATGENCRIQAFKIGETTWAVQFHADYNTQNVRELVELRKEVLDQLLKRKTIYVNRDSKNNCQVLENFLDIVRGG